MAKDSRKLCFVISPIGSPGSATRSRADKLKKYVIEEVFSPRGYNVVRADDVGEPGMITNQIVKKIVECDVLVADLSEHNPNVFYELAIRHGLKRPFIHIIDSSDTIPFDNAQVRTIQVDLTDLDSVAEARTQLGVQLDAVENASTPPESPISIAFDLEALKTSGKPDEAALGIIMEEMAGIRRELRSLKSDRLSRPNTLSRRSASSISSADEFYRLLSAWDPELGDYWRNHITISRFEPPRIYAELKAGSPYRDVDDETVQAIKKVIGEQWTISTVPF